MRMTIDSTRLITLRRQLCRNGNVHAAMCTILLKETLQTVLIPTPLGKIYPMIGYVRYAALKRTHSGNMTTSR